MCMNKISADKNITIRVPSPLVEIFRKTAKDNYKTMSEAIRDLMQEYIERGSKYENKKFISNT